MLSLKSKLSLVAALTLAVAAGSTASEVAAKNNTGAVVGGIIAGAAIGAAISSSSNHPTTIYVDDKNKNKNKDKRWKDKFSPEAGVNCYPAQHACYSRDGSYNARWTRQVF